MAEGEVSRYRVLLASTLTGETLGEFPAPRLMVSKKLNRAGSFELSVPYNLKLRHQHEDIVTSIERSQIEPVATSAYIFRNGTLLGGGIVWGARMWTHDHRLVLNGEGFWSYFQKRILHIDKVYSAIDHLTFTRELIDYAQGVPGGNIQVITGSETSGINSQVTYYGHEKHNIGHIIELLAERQAPRGFDFDIVLNIQPDDSVTRTLELYYPHRGRRTGHVFELRRNIDQLQLEIDGSRKANSVTGVGEGEGEDMLHATITDSNQLDTFPLLETKISHKDVKNLSTLDGHMRMELSLRGKSVEIPSLDVVTTAPQGQPGELVPGDSVRVVADDGPLQLDKYFRLVGWTLRVENGGRENYSMEFFEEGPGL